MLKKLNPDTLILAGINTHACIRMTAIDAYQRDWEVILAADCVGSYDQEHHEVSLRHMRENIASEKAITKNGGIFEGVVTNGEKPRKKRFWIDLRENRNR